jgi:hypothetical protein
MAFGIKKQQSSSEISREELTRTQVLNLQELERIAKFERQTSKRPAVLFAIAGILAITMGVFYPNIMMAVDSIGSTPKTSYRVDLSEKYDEQALPVPTDKVICNLSQYAQADATHCQHCRQRGKTDIRQDEEHTPLLHHRRTGLQTALQGYATILAGRRQRERSRTYGPYPRGRNAICGVQQQQ